MKREKLYLSTVDTEAADLSRKFGLGLELAEFCTAWNLDDEFTATDCKVRAEMEGLTRFTLHGPYNELFPCAIDRKARALVRDRFLETIGVAEGYGIRKIILHGGFDPHLYFPCWFIQESTRFFMDFVKEIPEDMTICLENVLEEQPSYLTDILRSIDDPRLRMCLDVGHAKAYSSLDPLDWISEARDVIDHFHVHNNNGTRDSHSGLMDGVIPMEALFNRIETFCPRATVTLELPEAAPSLAWMAEHNLLEEEK